MVLMVTRQDTINAKDLPVFLTVALYWFTMALADLFGCLETTLVSLAALALTLARAARLNGAFLLR